MEYLFITDERERLLQDKDIGEILGLQEERLEFRFEEMEEFGAVRVVTPIEFESMSHEEIAGVNVFRLEEGGLVRVQ